MEPTSRGNALCLKESLISAIIAVPTRRVATQAEHREAEGIGITLTV